VRTARIVTPRVMQLTLRAQQPALTDSQVRKAILGLVDVDLLASVGAGDEQHGHPRAGPGAITVRPGLRADRAAGVDEGAALTLLANAGYQVEPVETTPPPTPGTPRRRTTAGASPRTVFR